ncbi:MAG: PilN domain-containing protein [Sulfuritalea sp.]|nr:PilN domain-containing protein [Sulfuritalea sp.]
MQRLDLDFQKKPETWPLPGIVLLIAGIGLTAALLQHHVDVGDELTRAEGSVARLKRDVERQRLFDARSENRPANDKAPTRMTRSAEQWEALFGGLEAAADETVTLLSLEPGSAEISLRGEAKDFTTVTDYVKRLSSLSVLADVSLTEHEIARDHPRRPIRFSVRANWQEAPR